MEAQTPNGEEPQGLAQQDPAEVLYQESLQHFQNGKWQEAVAGFEHVLQLRPDHAAARAFLEETRLKASLDDNKPKPKRPGFRGPVRFLLLLLVLASAIVVLSIGLRWAYNRWITPNRITQQVELRKAQQMEAALKYLADRDYTAAKEAFERIIAEDPENQRAQEGLAEAEARLSLADAYTLAEQAIARQDWQEATRLLEAVIAQEPAYRDAQARLIAAQEQQRLWTAFDGAEKAYATGNWQEAIAAYEALRGQNREYQKPTVDSRLFESYLKQGIYLIESSQGESAAVRGAIAFYEKALALQPLEAQATREMALAQKYLEGQALLAEGQAKQAITALEWVCQQRPDYAGGNAAALLSTATSKTATPMPPQPTPVPTIVANTFVEQYANWTRQGDAAMIAADYASAEGHYRQASSVALHAGTDSARWLYVAYVKLGTAYSKGGKLEIAVQTIRTAIDIMTRSATAIPESAYADDLQQADRYADQKDYRSALAQYDKVLQVIGKKCNCGLEDWSVVP